MDTNGGFTIGRATAEALSERFGTPLFVYDGGRIRDNYRRVREAFPFCDVFYSLKANPCLAVCSLLRHLGAGAEIASGGELVLAGRAGFRPGDIIFAGPGKRVDELEAAVSQGIYSINAESETELQRIAQIAAARQVSARVSVRVNVRHAAGRALHRMGGTRSQFGIPEETLVARVGTLDLGRAELVGFHVYVGSQILDEEALFENLTGAVTCASRLAQALQRPVSYVGLGGGFGVPYSASEAPLQVGGLGSRFETWLDSSAASLEPGTRLGLELGRYLVADAGFLLTRVLDVKDARGSTYVITDGGMNALLRPAFTGIAHPIRILGRRSAGRPGPVTVVGPLCNPRDVLAVDLDVPRPEVGDLVVVENAGAYGFSMSMLAFLSHPWPAEVLIDGDLVHLARDRRDPERMLDDQHDVDRP